MKSPQRHFVTDVNGLNPVPVWTVVIPRTIDEIADALARTGGPVSIGGGRHSTGGQATSVGSLHLDMRAFNKVIRFSPLQMTIRVQAGMRWRELLRFLDPHDASVRIMPDYANFTVGGSLSANAHGSGVGLGPIVHATRWIRIVLADGSICEATPHTHPELFYSAIGGYGAIGVIAEAEIELVPNHRLQRQSSRLSRDAYLDHFRTNLAKSPSAVIHSVELYPPHFNTVRSTSWTETDKRPSHDARLQSTARTHPLHRYLVWATADGRWKRWRREYLIDPLLFLNAPVHWRNVEMSHDVGQLDPASQNDRYELQEYFVPADRVNEFLPLMASILARFRVRGIHVSMRHSTEDPDTLLAWSRGETFAIRLYHKQRKRDADTSHIAIWSRELIDAAISLGGCFYLPYHLHATREQFLAAYPRASEFFALKLRIDPSYRFRNALWDAYYRPPFSASISQLELTLAAASHVDVQRPPTVDATSTTYHTSNFRRVLNDPFWHDALYRHLQNVFCLYPEDRFHALIKSLAKHHADDESIYRQLLIKLPKIRPVLAQARITGPTLRRHKRDMATQVGQILQSLGHDRHIDGYLEFGTQGRYLTSLDREIGVRGPRVILNDNEPVAAHVAVASSFDLVTGFMGLNQTPPAQLDAFVTSLVSLLRYDGVLVLREYDAHDEAQRSFVSLTHTLYNAGNGVPWERHQQEQHSFAGLSYWVALMARHGLNDSGLRLRQPLDPSGNTLMAFVKDAAVNTLTMAQSTDKTRIAKRSQPAIDLVQSMREDFSART